MKQKGFLKQGLLRLILILAPLSALFSALILISRHNPPTEKNSSCPFMLAVLPPSENTAESPWLRDTRFFQSVLWDFNTGSYPSLELLFYLPLHFTKDNRWLVSTGSAPLPPQTRPSRRPPTTEPVSQNRPAPASPKSAATSPLVFKDIQERLFPQTPLTLKDLLSRFPNRKWFLHLMTIPPPGGPQKSEEPF